MYQSTIAEQFMSNFEAIKQYDQNRKEFWNATDVMKLLNYNEFRNFERVIDRAMLSFNSIAMDLCNKNKININNDSLMPTSRLNGKDYFDPLNVNIHFIKIIRSVNTGNGTVRQFPDYVLTRMACYAIAMCADPRKNEVKLTQQYMLVSLVESEKRKQYIENNERISKRLEYSAYENQLEHTLAEHGVHGQKQYGYVKSEGDRGFYGGTNTAQTKEMLGIPNNQPLADYMPIETETFKMMAQIKTKYGIERNKLSGVEECAGEAFFNNESMRQDMLKTTGRYPEETMPATKISTTKKEVDKIDKEIAGKAINGYIDPRLYMTFEYNGYVYTLESWCSINKIDPYFIIGLLDNEINFNEAIFMRPNNKICPIIFV